jgi:hypothetical protein
VYESAEQRIEEVFRELERVAVVTTSFIRHQRLYHSTEEGHPSGFVTIPDVEYILGSARDSMHADFVAYLPSISSQQESEYWTEYSEENIGWIAEANEVYISASEDSSQPNLVPTQPSNISSSFNEGIDTESEAVLHDVWRYNIYKEDGSVIDYNSVACPMWRIDKRNLDKEDTNAFDTAAAIDASRVLPYIPEPVVNEGRILSPVWTSSPPFFPGKTNIVNFNAQSDPTFHQTTQVVDVTGNTTFDDICSPTAAWMDPVTFPAERYAMVTTPVFHDNESATGTGQPILGHIMAVIPWTVFFSEIIGDGHLPVTVAVSNECKRAFTVLVQKGQDAILLNHTDDGQTDREMFHDMKLVLPLAQYAHPQSGNWSKCAFTVSIYPTVVMKEAYTTNKPIVFTLVVLVCFAFTSLSFIAFDCMQQRRQRNLVNIARRQNLLVSALFPPKIQNQLLAEMTENEAKDVQNKNQNKSGTAGLRQFLERERQNKNIGDAASWGSLDGREKQASSKKAKPIADLFPETTVMFADIVGKCILKLPSTICSTC